MTWRTKTGFFLALAACCFFPFQAVPAASALTGDIPQAEEGPSPEPYCRQAVSALTRGDSTGALKLLNQALDIDPKHGPALIWRGRLNLAAGDLRQARRDFNRALFDKSSKIKALAHVGLGHVLISNSYRTGQAIRHYRQAVKIDPTSYAALYNPAAAGYAYEKIAGKRIASEALARLVCLDPLYENAYRVWRDMILTKSDDEIREVDARLEVFLADHPDSAAWWADLAGDRFYLGETSRAMETLDSLLSANPAFRSPEIPLLKARCCLELGDTARFQGFYDQAVSAAGATGDFTSLFRQAEALFYPEAYQQWENCRNNRDRARFLRRFWAQLNADPLADHNSSLTAHYRRLRHAEQEYGLQLAHLPHSPSFSLSFDPQTLRFIRYGIWHKPRGRKTYENPSKFWFCGYTGLLFDELSADEEPDFQPAAAKRLENTMKANSMQIARDETIRHDSEFYFAKFLSPGGGAVQLEFYQAGVPLSGTMPRAAVAIFDTTWRELKRSESRLYKLRTHRDSSWLAVHSIDLLPGTYWFGVRMIDADSRKWVERGLIDIQAFDRHRLDFSRIVLGSLQQSGLEAHTRHGVEILPRPSLCFRQGEIVSVFFEIYNLKPDTSGLRCYTEQVDVTRIEDEAEKMREFAGGTVKYKRLDQDSPSTSLHHRFERVAETLTGPVAEYFTVDTGMLFPGNYRLVIKVRDTGSGRIKQTACIFELEE